MPTAQEEHSKLTIVDLAEQPVIVVIIIQIVFAFSTAVAIVLVVTEAQLHWPSWLKRTRQQLGIGSPVNADRLNMAQ